MDLKIVSFEPSSRARRYSEYSGGRSRSVPRKESPAGKSRVYVSVKGEGFWESFANRTTRPHDAWRPLVQQALREAGLPDKVRWSQKAGCSCPCSPGFFIDGHFGKDFWLTLEVDQPQTTNEVVSLARLASVDADPTLPDVLGGQGADLLEALK